MDGEVLPTREKFFLVIIIPGNISLDCEKRAYLTLVLIKRDKSILLCFRFEINATLKFIQKKYRLIQFSKFLTYRKIGEHKIVLLILTHLNPHNSNLLSFQIRLEFLCNFYLFCT